MKLIIAEKPSLGQNIIKSLGFSKFKKEDGYSESSEYIVTWAFGHLFSLYDIEDYDPENREEPVSWSLKDLPFYPTVFKFGLIKKPGTSTVDSGVKKQFNIIKRLLERTDVDCIVHAGDSDREGEIIIRSILEQAKNKKPVYRLWLPEQTEESIRSSLRSMKSDSEYDNLSDEGYARTYIDWLYGVNLTRLGTLKAGSLLRVGRVIVPIVEAIYNRDMEIRNFVPEPYIGLVSRAETKGQIITLTSKKTFDMNERGLSEEFCRRYNNLPAVVTDIKTEKKTIKPGKLFSLSTVQGLLGKKYKMSPKDSLAIIQKLYEAGYVTYPRTNTEYLAKAESGRINSILEKLKEKGYKVCPKDGKKSIYDDSKIESHSALTPTLKIPVEGTLNEKERQVYNIIFNRFLAVFCEEDCTVNRTTLTISLGENEEVFKIKGDIKLTEGWMQYEESKHSEKILPDLKTGDKVETNFELIDKQTHPPKHYTSDSLSKFLENPFKKETKKNRGEEDIEEPDNEDEDSERDEEDYKAMFEGVELGTVATRASIIEHAIKSGYIQLKNDIYTILPGGEFYIDSLRKLGICLSKEKTAEMGRTLKKVFKSELSIDESVDLAFTEIQELFDAALKINVDQAALTNKYPEIAACPVCGGIVREKPSVFACENEGCQVVLFKDNHFLKSLGKKMTASNAKALLTKGETILKNCKSKKSGKTFDCILSADFNGEKPSLEIRFPDAADLSLGACPKCGSEIIKDKFGNYSCSGWQKGCKYKIYGTVSGKKLTDSNIRTLLSKGKTGEINGFISKGGKEFSAKLILNTDGKVGFEFSNLKK